MDKPISSMATSGHQRGRSIPSLVVIRDRELIFLTEGFIHYQDNNLGGDVTEYISTVRCHMLFDYISERKDFSGIVK